MKRLHRPSIRISQFKTLRISKASIFIASTSLLVVLSAGVYVRHDNAAERSAKQQQTSSTVTKAAPVTSKPAKTVPVSTPDSTTPATTTTTTHPPMNRPGNRYTDESSAGPEKLTYNENKSLVISPASVTIYAGTPVTSEGMMQARQSIQISSSDGGTFGFPQATNAGGTIFATSTTDPFFGPPPMHASWTMGSDATRATPGTYTTTFTAWSPDRQTRYTGSLQVTILPLPAGM